jgi:hypothetical protein
MLRFLPASSTTCIAGFESGFGSNPPDIYIYPPLQGHFLGKTEWTRKWRKYDIGHNFHGPQPRHPNQACNKLKCYELTILNKKIDIFTYLPCGVPPPTTYVALTLKGTDLGYSSSDPWIFFNSTVYRSCKILSKYEYNK